MKSYGYKMLEKYVEYFSKVNVFLVTRIEFKCALIKKMSNCCRIFFLTFFFFLAIFNAQEMACI